MNVANSLLAGDGFVVHYLWTYVDAPESMPAPSYRYWMPLTSVLAAVGMALAAAPDSFQAAQFLFIQATAGAGAAAARAAGGQNMSVYRLDWRGNCLQDV